MTSYSPFDDSNKKDRPYGHCLVAGVDRYPRNVTRAMSRKQILRRTSIKPFVKLVNYNHIMPTRYNFESREESSFNGLKEAVSVESVQPAKRTHTKLAVKKIFEANQESNIKDVIQLCLVSKRWKLKIIPFIQYDKFEIKNDRDLLWFQNITHNNNNLVIENSHLIPYNRDFLKRFNNESDNSDHQQKYKFNSKLISPLKIAQGIVVGGLSMESRENNIPFYSQNIIVNLNPRLHSFHLFSNIKYLNCDIKSRLEFNQFKDFFLKNQSLETLKIGGQLNPHINELRMMADKHPTLVNLVINCFPLIDSPIFPFNNTIKSLSYCTSNVLSIIDIIDLNNTINRLTVSTFSTVNSTIPLTEIIESLALNTTIEEFSIKTFSCCQDNGIKISSLVNLFSKNKTLKKLKIDSAIHGDIHEVYPEHLDFVELPVETQLESLELDYRDGMRQHFLYFPRAPFLLDFSSNMLHTSLVSKLPFYYPRLETLELVHCNLAKDFIPVLDQFNHLQTLMIKYPTNNNDIGLLFDALQSNETIHTLVLEGFSVSENSFDQFFQSNQPFIKHLLLFNLSCPNFPTESLCNFNKTIESLFCGIIDQSLDDFIGMLLQILSSNQHSINSLSIPDLFHFHKLSYKEEHNQQILNAIKDSKIEFVDFPKTKQFKKLPTWMN
eukprot:gene3343-4191_t